MSQMIEVKIPIPEDFVLIPKEAYEGLVNAQLEGKWWKMSDLKAHTNLSKEVLESKILLRPRFKQVLDVNCGGFVKYPTGKGSHWLFLASEMTKFLNDYFPQIFAEK
ncbi:DUF771 domain-containing protein [Listeria booriae]|nr:DUF771 domain-containing protein [Listeria booriae]